jgi:drug/metabolite transporter (DMT)-like permease
LAFFRNLFSMLPVLAIIPLMGGWRQLRTHRMKEHFYRGVFGVVSLSLLAYTLHLLPLAEASIISYSGPFFITALSVPLLGERVGPHRFAAVVIGFIGIVIVTGGGSNFWQLGVLVGLGASFFYALAMISIRRLARTETPVTIVFYNTLFAVIAGGIILLAVNIIGIQSKLLGWQTPAAADLWVFVIIGILGALGQYVLTLGYKRLPAVVAAPFMYTSLIWSMLFGYIIWGDLLSMVSMLGAVVIVGSGLYIIHRESKK